MDLGTSCAGCCFASLEETTQTGCYLGRLERYVRLGSKVESRKEEHSGLDYYQIEGRLCNAKRPTEWAVGTTGDVKKKVLEELAFPVDVIVVVQEGRSIEDLGVTLESLAGQKIGTICVVNNSDLKYGEIRRYLDTRYEGSEQPWFITLVMQKPRPDYYGAVDLGFPKVTKQFYLAIEAGEVLPAGFISHVHNLINVEMRQVVLIYPETEQWYLGSTRVHKLLIGNEPASDVNSEGEELVALPNLPAKIQYWSEMVNNPDLIEQYAAA